MSAHVAFLEGLKKTRGVSQHPLKVILGGNHSPEKWGFPEIEVALNH
jgi:hypothetical protein